MGKPIGHDIAEGFATLPLMLAMEDPPIAGKLSRLLHSGRALTAAEAQDVVELVHGRQGQHQCLARARELSRSAREQLKSLGAGDAAGALAGLTNYVVSRKL